MIKLSFITLLLAGLTAYADPMIIPKPFELKELKGSLQLNTTASVSYADAEAEAVAKLIASQLRTATGYTLPVNPGTEGFIVFRTIDDDTLGREGYTLKADHQVHISAPTQAGLFYGGQTLRHLLPAEIFSTEATNANWVIPSVEIRDMPRFGWRGLHLDVSRHFMPKEDVFKFIDTMAAFKFNIFHMHLTDDQGWRIEIKKYPKLTEIASKRSGTLIGHYLPEDETKEFDTIPHGGYYTQEDLREFVAFAAERNITIVPEIDIPGHSQAAITAYPELGCTDDPVEVRKTWGISKHILNPEESTIEFYKDIFTEVMDIFPSEFIHIGGDEALKTHWENSSRIQQLREERGLKDMHEMQNWFIQQFDVFFAENGRRMIGWDEIGADPGLSKSAAIMWWRADDSKEIAVNTVKSGRSLVVAPHVNLYFDYYQGPESEEPLAIGGMLTLEQVYRFDPVIPEFKDYSEHVLGAQGQLWREYLPTTESVEYMAFPRSCALAEILWLPEEKKDYENFLKRMKTQEARFDAAGLNYRKITQQL